MNATDLPAIRHLIRLRRAAGWTHRPYGGGRHQDHVWTAPSAKGSRPVRPRKVTLYEGELEYRHAGTAKPAGAIVPQSIAEVVGFLRLHGLLPTIAQVAEVLLDADGADERSSSPNAVEALSDRHMSEAVA